MSTGLSNKSIKAMAKTLKEIEFNFPFSGYNLITEDKTEDILVFFAETEFQEIQQIFAKTQKNFITDLKTNLKEEGFEIVEERTLEKNCIPEINYRAHFFRVKKE